MYSNGLSLNLILIKTCNTLIKLYVPISPIKLYSNILFSMILYVLHFRAYKYSSIVNHIYMYIHNCITINYMYDGTDLLTYSITTFCNPTPCRCSMSSGVLKNRNIHFPLFVYKCMLYNLITIFLALIYKIQHTHYPLTTIISIFLIMSLVKSHFDDLAVLHVERSQFLPIYLSIYLFIINRQPMGFGIIYLLTRKIRYIFKLTSIDYNIIASIFSSAECQLYMLSVSTLNIYRLLYAYTIYVNLIIIYIIQCIIFILHAILNHYEVIHVNLLNNHLSIDIQYRNVKASCTYGVPHLFNLLLITCLYTILTIFLFKILYGKRLCNSTISMSYFIYIHATVEGRNLFLIISLVNYANVYPP